MTPLKLFFLCSYILLHSRIKNKLDKSILLFIKNLEKTSITKHSFKIILDVGNFFDEIGIGEKYICATKFNWLSLYLQNGFANFDRTITFCSRYNKKILNTN